MFQAKTEKISELTKKHVKLIEKLISIFNGKTRIYIDYANVRPWSDKLGWHIDLIRLKQFFDSFDTVEAVNLYNGYLQGNERSEREKREVENSKYILRTKPVKIRRISINVSSIGPDATALLKQFIRRALLDKYDPETITYLNNRFKEMNGRGEFFIEDKKCNFDVEIGIDMLLDSERNHVETFVLWSGDSDFADLIKKLLKEGKNVFLFATAGKISSELNDLKQHGLKIFDIYDLKEFICWSRELRQMHKGPH